MTRPTFGILALMSVFAFAGRDLVTIDIFDPRDVTRFDQIDVVINGVRGLTVEAEATPQQTDQLRAEGYTVTVLIKDIDEVYRRNFEEGRGRYLTYNEFIDSMNIIAQNNPTICKLDTLATTATGYLVLAMKISDNPQANEAEPRVMFEAGIHGDEKCGWAVTWEMLKYLVINYGSNTLVTRLVNTRELWIIPMLNPYGYINNIRYNSTPVDLNRNWGYMWRNFGGSEAFSEKETRAGRKAFDQDAFAIWTAYHGGAMVTLYPWGFHTDLPPDSTELITVGVAYSVATNNQHGYVIDFVGYIPGTSLDNVYGAEGILAVGPEISIDKTPPAYMIDPLFNTNRDPMLNLLRYAKWGIEGSVTDSATGVPLCRSMLEPVNPIRWISYTDSPNGDYHRYLTPGTYSVRFTANGYNPKTLSITVPADTSVSVDVQLSRSSGQNIGAVKYTVCCVTDPNRVFNNHSLSFWALGLQDSRRLSIGVRGSIDLDMGTSFANISGFDFTVVEGDADMEICTVFVATNAYGPWTRVGTAIGTTSFDLQTVGLSQARYVRLKDDGDGSANSATAGYDVDAVEAFTMIGAEDTTPDLITAGVLSASPNPFRHQTNFSIEHREKSIELNIFDVSGCLVRSFALGPMPSALCWDGTDRTGRPVPPGVYFVEWVASQPIKLVKIY